MPSKARVSHICFTLNNPGPGDLAAIQALTWVKYGIVGNETGESGTPHLQGYLNLTKRTALATVIRNLRAALSKAPHVEPCKGNPEQNIAYCSKDGDFVEWGDKPKQGKRTDLLAMKASIDAGKTMLEVADEHFVTWAKYHRAADKYQFMVQAQLANERRAVEVTLHTGPTGCGKTTEATNSTDYCMISGTHMAWFDGYTGQKRLVIDEYSNDVKITELLRILDGHKLRLPVKGGHCWALYTEVHITTNLKRDELHSKASDAHKAALWRRITHVVDYWDDAELLPKTKPKLMRSSAMKQDVSMSDSFIFD